MKAKLYTWSIPKQLQIFDFYTGQNVYAVNIDIVLTDGTYHNIKVGYNRWILINGRYDIVSKKCLNEVKIYIDRWNFRRGF